MRLFARNTTIRVILGIIVGVALYMRFYALADIPASLYWDEVSHGYNAYSIAHTGRDEYGEFYPLLFQAYYDYKFPAYIYLSAVVIKLFGLSEFTTRFVSAFLGSLTVLFLYFLTQELLQYFARKKSEHYTKNTSIVVALIAASLLAISPWHIQFSRAAFEANAGLFFIVAGLWLLIKGVKQTTFYYVGVLLLAISMYFYRSILVVTPLLLIATLIVFYLPIYNKKRITIIFLGLGLFILASFSILLASFSPAGLKRAQEVNIFTNSSEEVAQSAQKIQQSGDTVLSRVIYNRRVVYAQKIITNYSSHFNPSFLFITGDQNARHKSYGMGQIYLWEFPFLLLGIVVAWKISRRLGIFLLCWLLVAPIPASITLNTPHALRTLNIVPVLYILISLGVTSIWLYYPTFRKVYVPIVSIIASIFFMYYVTSYYAMYRTVSAHAWGDGYKQLVHYMSKNKKNYDKAVISGYYWQPYAYFLFYERVNPQEYQANGDKTKFGTYLFGGTIWDRQGYSDDISTKDLVQYAGSQNIIVALSPDEFAKQTQLVKLTEIRDAAHNVVFVIAKPK
jgi:4-amino-4-deoxy-L-arabinose transferase-like glycosyltransferase